ncbi:MarR family winged helix-turn-helix transcriptional regulator [Sediminicola luteus]|uniref:HTH marR-type domain-containing protein n=1 Tax=Sediminicola luteus TaxID=319238 RepID=A0A2A4GDY9_9FLAO|nr:MarR family transcriptional regulator [Sediminicola luteus]PCE66631.1 hypothetical protein B7P33_04875 [Sediminicola luteus]
MQELEEVILFQIDQTLKVAKKYSQREFDALGLGITVDQWVLLKVIAQYSGLNQRELAQRSQRDPASIKRTLDLLEGKGFIIRQIDAKNKRIHHIVLTQKGKAFEKEHQDMIQRHRRKSIAGFSIAEITQLSQYLKRIRNNMT